MFLPSVLPFDLFSLPIPIPADVEKDFIMDDVADETECPHCYTEPEGPLRAGAEGLVPPFGRTEVGSDEESITEVVGDADEGD